MYASHGPGGLYYSAIEKEPEMHPLIELGASLSPYAGLYAGAYLLKNTKYKDSEELTHYDILHSRTRNLMNRTPFGFGNTLRLSEMGSYGLSGEALGMEKMASLLDPSKEVRAQIYTPDMMNEDTVRILRSVVGEQAFQDSNIGVFLGSDTIKDYELRLEASIDNPNANMNLVFQRYDETYQDVTDSSGNVVGKEKIRTPKAGSTILVSNEVKAQHGVYGADVYDIALAENIDQRTNPAIQGVYQNLVSGEEVDYQNIFRAEDGTQARIMPVPSMSGEIDSLDALKRRTAVPASFLSMGINRFNKLLSATYNQIPILGKVAEHFLERTGLDLKTTPDAFYKQFMSLGLKATKLGAVSLGIATVDHYREKFGVLGNIVASSAVSMGIGYGYDKLAKSPIKGLSTKLGIGAFAIQMIMPGFDKGIIEGLATTATNIDIGRSYIGKYTGLSFVRRGIEGLLPGFTEFTTGLYLGLGAAALSYSEYPQNFIKRLEEGNLKTRDGLTKYLIEKFGGRFGTVDKMIVPAKKNDLLNARLVDILLAGKDPTTKEFSQDFLELNPFGKIIAELDNNNLSDPLVKEYRNRLSEIIDGKSYDELSKDQQKALKNFFKNNELLMEQISSGKLDRGQLKKAILDFDYRIQNIERSEVFKAYNLNVGKGDESIYSPNASLLKRIKSINDAYKGSSGILSAVGRRLEIFGAEMYHGFFGASMSGEVDVDIPDITTKVKDSSGEITRYLSYDEIAKELGATPIVKRFGALTLGVTLIHQMMTGAFFGMMEDPDELKAEYSGEKLVEIKKGRWWEAGGTAYEGGKTSYFRPHQYAMLMRKAKERAVWGDEVDEYNPLTRFFLKNFTYHLERKNYYDRPYPITGAAFEDVPVIGGLLASTIGRVIKPIKVMHEEELYRTNPETGLTEVGYQKEYGSSVELGQEPPGTPKNPYNLNSTLGNIQYQFREIEGLTGYAKNVLQKVFTGREVLGTRNYVMASSNQMDSNIRDYWDMDLGGFGFMSEPIRRLLPRPRAEIETYNPIMNSMPSYIPEKYKRGDPYRLLANGSVRLPGEGYAALNPELKGVDPEDYPLIHKYKILADIAPQSRTTLKMREELFERKAAGILTSKEDAMLSNISEYHFKRLAATRDDLFHENAIKIPFLSDLVGSTYNAGTSFLRKGTAAIENMIPGGFRPTQKLLGHTRSAIEKYEMERLYNTSNSFWDAPFRDWFRPAVYSAAHFLGWDGKPLHVQKREALNEHFDKLQFIKFMNLAENATNGKDKKRYLELASRTRMGVNPNGDALSLYLSLPGAEKEFFDSFANATGNDRERILEMVPEDQKHLYQSMWSKIDAGEDASLISSGSVEINKEYLDAKYQEALVSLGNQAIPEVDWIGWHKDVDIEDIKVKYVENIGAEIHDYDMWESQVRRVSRRPYLEGADLFLRRGDSPNRNNIRQSFIRGADVFNPLSSDRMLVNTSNDYFENSRAHLEVRDARSQELRSLVAMAMRG